MDYTFVGHPAQFIINLRGGDFSFTMKYACSHSFGLGWKYTKKGNTNTVNNKIWILASKIALNEILPAEFAQYILSYNNTMYMLIVVLNAGTEIW